MIEFDRIKRSFSVNPDRLRKSEQATLARLVRIEAPKEKVEQFVSAVSEIVDCWEKANPERMSIAARVEAIKRVESESRRLLSALQRFAGEPFSSVSPHFDYLALAEDQEPPEELPTSYRQRGFGQVCNELVERIEVVQRACEYARSEFIIDRTSKESLNRARSLVWYVALAHKGRFGTPPACGKTDWFPEFMQRLGEIVKHDGSIGRALVAGVVDRIKGNG